MGPPEIVIDTNVIVSALHSPRGASFRLLNLVGTDRFSINLSVALVLEYEEVGLRLLSATELTEADLGAVIDYLCRVARRRCILLVATVSDGPVRRYDSGTGRRRRGDQDRHLQRRRLQRRRGLRPAGNNAARFFDRNWGNAVSTISLRLPESLHAKAREVAEQEQVSLNQFITQALAEKLSALLTEEYLSERAKRGSRKAFRAALAKVADVEPDAEDQL
ncbi:MAG: PIN domain-containing protein [Gemmataceae bacterium]